MSGRERGCPTFLSQILNSLEQKVEDVVIHTLTVKQM